jgi:hypothetical protein
MELRKLGSEFTMFIIDGNGAFEKVNVNNIVYGCEVDNNFCMCTDCPMDQCEMRFKDMGVRT